MSSDKRVVCLFEPVCVRVGAFLPTIGSAIPLLDPYWFSTAHVRTSLRISMYPDRGVLRDTETAGVLIARNFLISLDYANPSLVLRTAGILFLLL